MQKTLDALNSPIRREILWLLRERELAVGEIGGAFEVTAPTISSHLAVLRDAGLISVRADGNFRYYRLQHQALAGLHDLLGPRPGKWIPITPPIEPLTVNHDTNIAIRVNVAVACTRQSAFAAFTDAACFTSWLGVPVVLDNGRFAATLEWGTRIRGRYDVVVAPELIAMRWDFDDDAIPIPGRELVAYLRFAVEGGETRIEVQQLVTTTEQAEFMHSAWGYVLGQFARSIACAASTSTASARSSSSRSPVARTLRSTMPRARPLPPRVI